MNNGKKYPIKIVANKTGLSMHVIRAWEKRYNAVTPERTDTNRRLYSAEDILKLQLLSKATELGHSVGEIAGSSTSELKSLVTEEDDIQYNASELLVNQPDTVNADQYIDRFLSANKQLDIKKMELTVQQASISMSRPNLLEKVIAPIIEKIGENWRDGAIRIYHEHIATNVIRSFLSELNKELEYELNAPKLIVTTLKGHIHELGAMLAAASAAAEGWRVNYLGPNLPIEEIVAAAQAMNTKLVCLSIVYPPNDPIIIQELEKLGQLLPTDISVLVGGRAVFSYKSTLNKIGAKIVKNIQELRNHLRNLENQLLKSV